MTPEELAVIQAAMELRYKILAHPEALRPLHNANNALTPVLSELSRVTYQLAISCPECNAGGHTCPGDGNHIPHGANDCGEHACFRTGEMCTTHGQHWTRCQSNTALHEETQALLGLDAGPEGSHPDGCTWPAVQCIGHVKPATVEFFTLPAGQQRQVEALAGRTLTKHAGADGACPDYGSKLDPCPPGCASGVCVVNQPSAFSVAADVCVCSRVKPMYCAASDCHGGVDIEPTLIWVPRTWADVRTGDRVKAPGSDATAHVQSAVHLRWHVKPGTGTSAYNEPVPLQWAGVRVMIFPDGAQNATSYEMDPAKPVEIELAESEVHVLNGLGWENRVGLVQS